jgi:hypothetical protein
MTSSKAAVAALLCCVSALVTGCSTSQFAGSDTTPVAGAALRGTVYGGQNPVTSAAIQLWTVGAGGYGSAAATLGTQLSTDPVTGTFTYSGHPYTCPSGSTQVYITSSGGNPGLGTGTNSNIMLAAALGNCGNLSSSTNIVINEVTTAAAAYALGQYFTPAVGGLSSADSFGAPNTTQAQAGIANAMLTVNNLVTVATGNAVTTATLTSGSNSVTVTPESAKLYSIANILATCVNSAGGTAGCGALFSDVTPTGGAAPTDTLQAAVYMSLNPTSANTTAYPTNLAAICALVTATPAFSSTGGCPGTVPTDWTLGIQYTNSGVLNDPQNAAVDASGNIWVTNHNGTSSASLTELSGGIPATSVLPGTPLVNVSTIGGQSINATQPRNEAIDTNGNVWVTTSSTTAQVVEYNPTTPTSSVGLADPTNKAAWGIAIDGSNNVFYTHESGSSTFSVMEFLGGTLATTSLVEYQVYNPSAIQEPEYAAIDPSGNLWMTNGSAVAGLEQNIFQMSGYNGSTACTVFPCNVASDSTLIETYTNMTSVTNGVPTLSLPYGIAAGKAGTGVWMANQTGNTVTNMTSTTAGTDYGSGSGVGASLNKPQYVAIDGVNNVWVSNAATSTTSGSASEFVGSGTGVGTILSPVSSGTAPFTATGFTHANITTAEGIAIDPSGNVWIASQSTTSGGVVELVGAAAPTVTPISLALKNTAIGAKP